jgi:hypothetical protein
MISLRTPALLVVLVCACAPSTTTTTTTATAPSKVSAQQQAIIGNDGMYTVTTLEVLNQYSALAQSAVVGATSLKVADITQLDSANPQLGPITAGDLLLIVQMQGATINTSDSANFGTVANLANAGLHEFIEVAAVDRPNNLITLGNGCQGLKNAYDTSGAAQVVRVPQFATLTVSSTGTVTSLPWDGTRGGVVAVHVQGTLSLLGTMDVSAQGFRGGVTDTTSAAAGVDQVLYRSRASPATERCTTCSAVATVAARQPTAAAARTRCARVVVAARTPTTATPGAVRA